MKKVLTTLIVLALIFAIGGTAYFYVIPAFVTSKEEEQASKAYVSNVEEIVNGFSFLSNRYSGVVETQELVKVDVDNEKKIKKTYVKEGDIVKKGGKLFEYDVEEMNLQLEEKKLRIAEAENIIKDYNTQIESLEKEKKTLSTNKQLTLSNQIDGLKLEIKKSELQKGTLEKEINKLEISVKNAVVKSSVNGTIKSVDDPNTDSYITIASDGDYRIKAVVSETNMSDFYEGDKMIIRSRIDDSTWTGKVVSIDTAKPITDTNAMGGESTTKYPVYISIDNTTGLLIGQHITVEKDLGIIEHKGLWLDDYFILDMDTNPYVWAEGDNKTLVKLPVTLGEHDAASGKTEITGGLTMDDYIAAPEERFFEGMEVTYIDNTISDDMMGENMDVMPIEGSEEGTADDSANSQPAEDTIANAEAAGIPIENLG